MATVQQAAALAHRGFRVFRLEKGTKDRFIDTDWARGGATDCPFDVVERFGGGADHNIGVLATGLLILDVDAHKGGFESLAALEVEVGPLPATFRVRTPRGGAHLYFKAPAGAAFANSVEKLGPGLDVRATNGYVVGPGSTWEGKAYVIENDAPVADSPPALAARVTAARARALDAARVVGEVDTPAARAAALSYLRGPAPAAVEGAGGNSTAYRVACHVLDLGCSPETTLDYLAEVYNARCSPPWDDSELETLVSNAARYLQNAIGSKNPAGGFAAVDAETAALIEHARPKTPQPAPECDLLEYAADVHAEEFAEQQARALVADLIGPKELTVIYGDSAAGKSFLAVDLCYHVAGGNRWHGRRVNQAPVLYVSLEGVEGFRRRMLAARIAIGDPGVWFGRLKPDVALDATEDGAHGMREVRRAYTKLMADARSPRGGLIVIDTLARAIAGDDENETKVMSAFVKRCGLLAKETGAAVVLVHHTNKQGVIRGSGALFAAADCVVRVERNKVDRDQRRALGEKVKDGRDGAPLVHFALSEMTLHTGAPGCEPVTSCVIRPLAPGTVWREPEDEKKAAAGFKAVKT